MISVPNRLRLLNGNNSLIVTCLLAFLTACSPKVVPVKPEVKEPEPEKEVVVKPPPPKKEQRDHSIALLLPFELNNINPRTAGTREIGRAEMAIDFYQGFELALDSLSSKGHNFMLNVLDTEDQRSRIVGLARSVTVRENDLVIGPVFPESVSTFSEFSDFPAEKLQISPLAASIPDEAKKNSLLTVNNTIEQHGWKIADYINRNYKPEGVNIVLINTQKTDDEKFAAPVRKYLNELSGGKFRINERPNAIGLQDHIRADKINVVILTSSDRPFILPTIDRLYNLGTEGYNIELFGHPNWIKASYLDAQKMQAIHARITTSTYIDYNSPNVKHFMAGYRKKYSFEPSEFSFKGFDIGYYFGLLLQKYGKDYVKHLGKDNYKGLHNNFRFVNDPNLGYVNTELILLTYRSFDLVPVK